MSESPIGGKKAVASADRQEDTPMTIPLIRVVEHAALLAQAGHHRVFVVGGMVRDIFSHGRIGDADLDLVVEGEGIPFAHTLAGVIGGSVKEHPKFHTAKLLPPFRSDECNQIADQSGVAAPLSEVDIASARSERYARPGALPEVSLTSIEKDLFRRDFSVNAVALLASDFLQFCRGELSLRELHFRAVDPCGGLADLDHKTLRVLHERSFIDDPTRLFRCVRYSVRLGLSVDDDTTEARLTAVREGALGAISTKRIWNEVVACASEPRGAQMLRLCNEWGLYDRTPFLGSKVYNECVSVVERLHSRHETELHRPEIVEIVLAATILRNADAEAGSAFVASEESPLHSLQLPRPLQRKAAALAREEHAGKSLELFESATMFDTLHWVVTGVV